MVTQGCEFSRKEKGKKRNFALSSLLLLATQKKKLSCTFVNSGIGSFSPKSSKGEERPVGARSGCVYFDRTGGMEEEKYVILYFGVRVLYKYKSAVGREKGIGCFPCFPPGNPLA